MATDDLIGMNSIDDFAVGQRLALRQPAGLVFDPLMGLKRSRKLSAQTRPLVLQPEFAVARYTDQKIELNQ
jgi:hypothetical protein